jgi:putative transposase
MISDPSWLQLFTKAKEGFFVALHLPNSSGHHRSSFQDVAAAFLDGAGLPFEKLLSANRIQKVFAKHSGLFGLHGVYTTAIMVWSFLGQVLRDSKEASCQAAVARIVSYCLRVGIPPPSSDTGDYCRARAKISEPALRELSCDIAQELEDAADEAWLWKGRHPKLIDGSTFTMPDTEENQAEFPQSASQAPGIGFPIARIVVILSLATACVLDAELGPYAGKETGESALFRSMLKKLRAGDIAVFDRYYCSFMMIALLQLQGTDACARLHQKRKSDFRRGRRLGKYDHIIIWTRPKRPDWMDEATYEQIPRTIELREIRFTIVEKGRRTKSITIVTTLLDVSQYSAQDIADLYGFRWNSELDLRSIKDALHLEHVRCKTPHMVRREVRATLLAYNLIRTTAASAALLHDQQPRQISFTSTCQYILASWMFLSCGLIPAQALPNYCLQLLKQIATCQVANRPGRLEPRVLKRRLHSYDLMNEPREVLRAKLRKRCT